MNGKHLSSCCYVIVEVPKGSRNKYEYDPLSKRIKLDMVLFSDVHYPAD